MKKELSVRLPAVAGSFYPADKEVLNQQIEEFLSQAPQPLGLEKQPVVLIVPHAGYEYSGLVAATGFKQLVGSEIEKVILLGVSHQTQFSGAAVYPKGFWQTPLGKVEVDSDLASKIIASSNLISPKVNQALLISPKVNQALLIFKNQEYHQQEHSLEVELPFLQKVLPNFKIVPILMGSQDENLIEDLASVLAKNIDFQTILIISSDFSHYPSYEDANEIDEKTIEAILSGKIEKFDQAINESMTAGIPNLVTCACGEQAIKGGMKVAQKLGIEDIRLIKYANSGDITGDKSRVVGYASIGFYDKSSKLQLKSQKELLKIARTTLEYYLKEGKMPNVSVDDPKLDEELGVFVTLRKNGQLRGCIGELGPNEPLWKVVRQKAIDAAIYDPRFLPVTFEELEKIKIEISVLSPQKKISDWRKIELGKHGVVVKKGLRSGVFLPQVATENNWDLDTFMGQLCSQKAGLPWDCWKGKDTELFVFTAQVFEEEIDT